MRQKITSSIPWFAAVALYGVGIFFIHAEAATLAGDMAKLAAMALQAILAGGIIHGLTKVIGVIREVGVAIDRDKTP
jgi:hypothetical protein